MHTAVNASSAGRGELDIVLRAVREGRDSGGLQRGAAEEAAAVEDTAHSREQRTYSHTEE